jgi:phosphomevalonate kinase
MICADTVLFIVRCPLYPMTTPDLRHLTSFIPHFLYTYLLTQLAAANLPARLDSLAQLTPFCPLPRPIGETNKTGLGSSAALVTSLVSGLLLHFGLADLDSSASRDEMHCLAQAAHCLAQGKVGSGFDVASAVYGTHVYRRFSPAALEPLFDGSSASVLDVIRADTWDTEQRAFRLPRGLRLLLADVDAGTDTPSFVGKVLQWRKNKPEEGECTVVCFADASRSQGALGRSRRGEPRAGSVLRRPGRARGGRRLRRRSGRVGIQAH